MAKTRNKVFIQGNVGADPELRYTPQGTPVAAINVATTERFKDKDGQFQERTEWHRLIFWNRLAEIVKEYVKKGWKLDVEGRLQTRSWPDKEYPQFTHYKTEVIVQDLILLGGPRSAEEKEREAFQQAWNSAAPAEGTGVDPENPLDIPF